MTGSGSVRGAPALSNTAETMLARAHSLQTENAASLSNELRSSREEMLARANALKKEAVVLDDEVQRLELFENQLNTAQGLPPEAPMEVDSLPRTRDLVPAPPPPLDGACEVPRDLDDVVVP